MVVDVRWVKPYKYNAINHRPSSKRQPIMICGNNRRISERNGFNVMDFRSVTHRPGTLHEYVYFFWGGKFYRLH